MSVVKNIEKPNRKLVEGAAWVTYVFNGRKWECPLKPRLIVDNVDDNIEPDDDDEKKMVLHHFCPADAYEDYMIESGNFDDVWNDGMRDELVELLEGIRCIHQCQWELDDERIDAMHLESSREKVYYIPGVLSPITLEDILYYKWKIPVKKVNKKDSP